MTDSTERLAAREPRIQDRSEQPYLGVPRHVTSGVRAAVDSAFPELFAWLNDREVAPAGPPFLRYREVDAAGEPLVRWMAANGVVYGHDTNRGLALPCCVDHLRIGPVEEPDASKWETELAYLVVD